MEELEAYPTTPSAEAKVAPSSKRKGSILRKNSKFGPSPPSHQPTDPFASGHQAQGIKDSANQSVRFQPVKAEDVSQISVIITSSMLGSGDIESNAKLILPGVLGASAVICLGIK